MHPLLRLISRCFLWVMATPFELPLPGAQIKPQCVWLVSTRQKPAKLPMAMMLARHCRRNYQSALRFHCVLKQTDRYGRTVAEVLKGTININQALVGASAAFVYWQYIEGCDRETYSRLEHEARLKSLGVLSAQSPNTLGIDYCNPVLISTTTSKSSIPQSKNTTILDASSITVPMPTLNRQCVPLPAAKNTL